MGEEQSDCLRTRQALVNDAYLFRRRRLHSFHLNVDMSDFEISRLAVPGVSLLIFYLSYTSQVLFLYIEPSPLTNCELVQFNLLVLFLWICYARTCSTNPGHVPQTWAPTELANAGNLPSKSSDEAHRQRWCRKCEAFKPPRAHHCKTCRRLVVLRS